MYFLPFFAMVAPSGVGTGGARSSPASSWVDQETVTPMDRAVPATVALAASRSLALRSGILVWAISVSWASVMEPAVWRPVVVAPLSMPAAWRMSTGVGG